MAKYKCLHFIILISFIVQYAQCAKILGIYHVPNKSHYTIGLRILQGLAAKGHEVTIASPFPEKNQNSNITEIFIDGILEIAKGKIYLIIPDRPGFIHTLSRYREINK